MGQENLKTLVISGDGFVGQGFNPHSDHWRCYDDKNYVRAIDFDAKGWRIQRIRGEAENPPAGGAGTVTPAPDQNQNQVTMVGVNFNNQIEYDLLPAGFLRAALENNATVRTETVKGQKYTVLTFLLENSAPNGGYKTSVSGWINAPGYVERVSTTIDNNEFDGSGFFVNWPAYTSNGVLAATAYLQVTSDGINLTDPLPPQYDGDKMTV